MVIIKKRCYYNRQYFKNFQQRIFFLNQFENYNFFVNEITKFDSVRSLLIILLLLVVSSCSNNEKPNIIWITCEDQSYYLFPFHGNSDVSLPNLEKIASESLVFENMYATYPVCVPARSSIITGMYPQSIGTHNMRAMHYDNYYKNGREMGDRNNSEKELEFPRYSSKLAESIKTFPEILRNNGYFTYNDSKGDYNYIISDSVWSAYNTRMKFFQDSSPFFAIFNFDITHERRMWERDKQELMVNPKNLTIPQIFPDDSLVRHSYAVNYSNMIEMDRQIGELIERLKSQELYDDSYIFLYSDHGGPFPRHKEPIYETGTKTPFLLSCQKAEKKKSILNSF